MVGSIHKGEGGVMNQGHSDGNMTSDCLWCKGYPKFLQGGPKCANKAERIKRISREGKK